MIFDSREWGRCAAGFSTYDCTAMDSQHTFYVLVENTEDCAALPRKRFLYARADRPIEQRRFLLGEFDNFGFTDIAYRPAGVEFVAVDTARQVFSYDRRRAGQEADIPGTIAGSELQSSVTRVVRVGSQLYAVGWPRRVWRRDGFESWTLLDRGLPLPAGLARGDGDGIVEAVTQGTLRDLDGFSEAELYAVGDGGEVWRGDGASWTRCAFPGDERLCTVACGADQVYVTTLHGRIWAGREDTWRLLRDVDRGLPFLDTCWFGGRLWCGADEGVWLLEGDDLTARDIPPEVGRVARRLDRAPDGRHLLTAGANGAALFDGRRWEVLWSAFELG
jgi:hypothetical protein